MVIIAIYLLTMVFDLGLLFYFLKLPIEQREEAFFGYRVSSESYHQQGRQILTRYRYALLAAFILVEAATLLMFIQEFGTGNLRIGTITFPRVLALLLLSLMATILYQVFSRQAAVHEESGSTVRVASSLKTRRLGDYTNGFYEVALSLLLFIPMMVLLWSFSGLPQRIPWLLDSNGQVEGWLNKDIVTVFSLPFLIVYAQGWFLLLKHAMTRATMTLPVEHTIEYLRHKEEDFRLGMTFLDRLRLVFALPQPFVVAIIIFSAIERGRIWQIGGILFGLGLGIYALLIFRSYERQRAEVNRLLKAETGITCVQRVTDTGHWHLGKLCYYNPDSSAIFIESPVG
ncbi:MAG: DUF1648 domain-containing protein, partial [Acidobacteria bacterium]|nr:DUF1648 domain-containing protein [Acidobacteriota bacterium]